MSLPELRLGPLNTETDLRIAAQQTMQRINEVIRAANSLEESLAVLSSQEPTVVMPDDTVGDALTAHEEQILDVHGISDTSQLVYTGDARFTTSAEHIEATTNVHGIEDTALLWPLDPVEKRWMPPAGYSILLLQDPDTADGGSINAHGIQAVHMSVDHVTVYGDPVSGVSLYILKPMEWAGGSDPFIILPPAYPTVPNLSAALLEDNNSAWHVDRANHTGVSGPFAVGGENLYEGQDNLMYLLNPRAGGSGDSQAARVMLGIKEHVGDTGGFSLEYTFVREHAADTDQDWYYSFGMSRDGASRNFYLYDYAWNGGDYPWFVDENGRTRFGGGSGTIPSVISLPAATTPAGGFTLGSGANAVEIYRSGNNELTIPDTVKVASLQLTAATTAATATTGAAALPANPVGFKVEKINGTDRKIPYYAM